MINETKYKIQENLKKDLDEETQWEELKKDVQNLCYNFMCEDVLTLKDYEYLDEKYHRKVYAALKSYTSNMYSKLNMSIANRSLKDSLNYLSFIFDMFQRDRLDEFNFDLSKKLYRGIGNGTKIIVIKKYEQFDIGIWPTFSSFSD